MNISIGQLINFQASELAMIVLMCFLILATITDFDHRKIPNWLTATGIVVGLVLTTASNTHSANPIVSFLAAFIGGSVGLLLLLPLYALGKMGAGDVKLMAMSGTFLGASGIVWAWVWSLIAGGVIALLWIIFHVGLKPFAFRLVGTWSAKSISDGKLISDLADESILKSPMPYAASIASGVFLSHWIF